MGSEKRRSERFDVSSPLNVVDTISAQSLGIIVNVSAEGMMVLGAKDIVEGAVYQVDVPITSADNRILKLAIECLWSAEADSGGKYWSGYQVIDISDDNKVVLDQLISELQ